MEAVAWSVDWTVHIRLREGVGTRYTAVQTAETWPLESLDGWTSKVTVLMLMLCVRCMQCDFAACPAPR